MIVCPNCRIENLEGALRCKNCGMPLARPLEAYQQPVTQYTPPQMYQQPPPQPGYPAMQMPIQSAPKPKTAKPIAGGIITMVSSIVGMIGVLIAVLMLQPGYYYPDWFWGLMIMSMICGFIAVPLSVFAFLRRHYAVAVVGGVLSVGAAWGMLGMITMAIAIVGLILIAVSKKEFD